jgi:hypothetical protein
MRAKRERAVTCWNPGAQSRPVLDSSSFVHVPMLPPKLATILLLAFSLFELVAALSQCLGSERNKKNGEVGNTHNRQRKFLTNKIFLLQVMYRYILMTFVVKCVTVTFFPLLMQYFYGKAWFLLFCHPLKLFMILYSTSTVFFHCSIFCWGLG